MRRNHGVLLLAVLLAACMPVLTATPASLPTAAPTATSSPTPLVPSATPTPDPTPTPVPPTATPTSPPPTSTHTPLLTTAVDRILFAPGATQATVEGVLLANATQRYMMHVEADQYVAIDAAVGTTGQGLRLSVVGVDGTVVRPMGDAHARITMPSTQDYTVDLVSDVGTVDYQMSVIIPVRVRFAPGTESSRVDGSLAADGVRHYVLWAQAGQQLVVSPSTTQGQVKMVIWGADGQVLLSGRVGPPGGRYAGALPRTQDYLIAVQAEGGTGAEYVLEITVPPL